MSGTDGGGPHITISRTINNHSLWEKQGPIDNTVSLLSKDSDEKEERNEWNMHRVFTTSVHWK